MVALPIWPPEAQVAFLLSPLGTIASLVRHGMFWASLTSWSFHCNYGFMHYHLRGFMHETAHLWLSQAVLECLSTSLGNPTVFLLVKSCQHGHPFVMPCRAARGASLHCGYGNYGHVALDACIIKPAESTLRWTCLSRAWVLKETFSNKFSVLQLGALNAYDLSTALPQGAASPPWLP